MSNPRKHNAHRLLGTAMVTFSGFLYGMVGYFGIQLFYQGFSMATMLFWRFLAAALWMLLIACLSSRRRAKLSGKMMLFTQLASVGAVSYASASLYFYLSSLEIGTGPAMVIFFSFPVFVMLFSLIFKHSTMNRFVVVAILMVVIGLIFLNGSGSHNLSNWGIFLALIASFSYAIYVYCSQHSSKKVDSTWLTLFICIGCALIFFIYSIVTHTFRVPDTTRAWKDILILGILATAIPIQLLLNGLKYISSVNASILSVLEPIMTVVIGILFLNESLAWIQFVGILIILSGAIVIQFEKQPDFTAKTPLK